VCMCVCVLGAPRVTEKGVSCHKTEENYVQGTREAQKKVSRVTKQLLRPVVRAGLMLSWPCSCARRSSSD
jgi:hypothetical protein